MDELLQQMETRVRLLLKRQAELIKTNAVLTQNKRALVAEKEHWALKNKNAIGLIQNVIARLKTIEEPR